MSSPFTIFRRHQRILTVILTGLAMVSFVLLGAVSDPREMPAALVILALAAMVGGVGWMAGLASGKASEWGMTGVLMGLVVGLAVNWYNREPNLILMEGGDLSRNEVAQLRREREMANFFVQRAFAGSGERSQFDYLITLPQFLFGITAKEDPPLRELALDAVLRREADRLGIVISDQAVKDFITELTGGKMTGDLFREIRDQLQVSEAQLFKALRNEIKAREAARILYDPNFIPPETYWDYYKKLNVRQSADVAAVSVSQFIDKDAKPTDSELQELFAKYRDKFPSLTPEGRPEPGFIQPPRAKLAYLEAVHDDIERTVGEVTEAEIQKRYEEMYVRPMPPQQNQTQPGPGSSTATPPELPAPPASSPETETTTPASDKDGKAQLPNAPAQEKPAEPPSSPQNGQSEGEADQPQTQTEDAVPSGENTGGETSAIPQASFVPVAFYQDQPGQQAGAETEAKTAETPLKQPSGTTEAAATAQPNAESTPPELPPPAGRAGQTSAAAEKPAAGDQPAPDEKPASEQPAGAAAQGQSAEGSAAPAGPPPLDDQLKRQIRDEILQERTRREIDKRIQAANEFMHGLSYNMGLGEEEENFMTEVEVAAAMKKYAQDHDLVYVETDLVSFDELRGSEDYAIGSAYSTVVTNASVPELVFSRTRDLYQPGKGALLNPENYSAFSYWKVAEVEGGVPDSIDEPKVREQVIEAWRIQQAWPKAKARAEELVKIAAASDKPMAEALSDETVTGREGGIFLTVQNTGSFTWMSRPIVPPTGLQQSGQVMLSRVNGAEQAGPAFMETVFQDLKPGDTGIAPGQDGTVLYVVHINERFPSGDTEYAQLRKQFIDSGNMSAYSGLAQMTMQEFSGDWVAHMLEQYEVRILADQPE